MDFEFDPEKSVANKEKHGIDFIEAQTLWRIGGGVVVPARSQDEERHALIGMIEGKHWIGYYTMRGGTVRIISVRRARDAEKRHYEDHNRS